jgi:putative oxidoreductase
MTGVTCRQGRPFFLTELLSSWTNSGIRGIYLDFKIVLRLILGMLQKPIAFFFKDSPSGPGTLDFGLFLWRLFLGASMAVAHGWGKIPVSEGFVQGVGSLGFPVPVVFAWAAALSEFLGGILLALGLATRFAALSVIITMGVAAFGMHLNDGFSGMEMALLYFVGAMPFLFYGAGRFSLDRALNR